MAETVFDRLNDWARKMVVGWLNGGMTMQQMTEEQKERTVQALIVTARNYYAGDQVVYKTPRQKAFVDLHDDAKLVLVFNHCKTVIEAAAERLKVERINTPQDAALGKLFWDWWTANRMDAMSSQVHRDAMRDGETFVLARWDVDEDRPVWVPQPRYVSKESGGDGFGVWMEYPQNNVFLPPTKAVKVWEDVDKDGRPLLRKNEYYPDRIEKYALVKGQWAKYPDPEDGFWPIPFIGADEKPLGIPLAHFKMSYLTSDLKDVIPIQDAYNKAWLDILAASDSAAFRTLVTMGWVPTTDGQAPKTDGTNLLRVAPGTVLSTLTPPSAAGVEVIEPGDLSQLLSVEERLILTLARLTSTPSSRFQTTGQVAAEGTLKQQESSLISKVQDRQTLLGNGWEDLLRVSMRLGQVYAVNKAPLIGKDSRTKIETGWKDPNIRNDKEMAETAEIEKGLGMPLRFLLKRLGLNDSEIEEVMGDPETKMRLENMAVAGEALRASAANAANPRNQNTGTFPNNNGGSQ